jgi:hypothetical protein
MRQLFRLLPHATKCTYCDMKGVVCFVATLGSVWSVGNGHIIFFFLTMSSKHESGLRVIIALAPKLARHANKWWANMTNIKFLIMLRLEAIQTCPKSQSWLRLCMNSPSLHGCLQVGPIWRGYISKLKSGAKVEHAKHPNSRKPNSRNLWGFLELVDSSFCQCFDLFYSPPIARQTSQAI